MARLHTGAMWILHITRWFLRAPHQTRARPRRAAGLLGHRLSSDENTPKISLWYLPRICYVDPPLTSTPPGRSSTSQERRQRLGNGSGFQRDAVETAAARAQNVCAKRHIITSVHGQKCVNQFTCTPFGPFLFRFIQNWKEFLVKHEQVADVKWILDTVSFPSNLF